MTGPRRNGSALFLAALLAGFGAVHAERCVGSAAANGNDEARILAADRAVMARAVPGSGSRTSDVRHASGVGGLMDPSAESTQRGTSGGAAVSGPLRVAGVGDGHAVVAMRHAQKPDPTAPLVLGFGLLGAWAWGRQRITA